MELEGLKIKTEVPTLYDHLISEDDYNKLVKKTIHHVLEGTKDNKYEYKHLMLWVAEQTRSVVRQIDSKEFEFCYVGC